MFVSTSPPSILCLTYSTGRGALLCFDLLLYSVVDVWRGGVSADLWACPSPPFDSGRRPTGARPLPWPVGSHVTA